MCNNIHHKSLMENYLLVIVVPANEWLGAKAIGRLHNTG